MKLNASFQRAALVTATAAAASLTLASCGGGDGGGGGGAGTTTMNLDFPKPLFQGTPVPVELPNLEKPGDPRLTFDVPEGSTNVAAGKTVTSSAKVIIFGSVDLVTDGDKAGTDGTYVELDPGHQWVQIDLEKEEEIHNIIVWHYHKAASAYLDVNIQISNDPEFADGSETVVFNSDDDDTAGLGVGSDPAYIETNHGRIIDVSGVTGQYVRLWSKGNTANDLNHYVEVEVWAAPAAEAAAAE